MPKLTLDHIAIQKLIDKCGGSASYGLESTQQARFINHANRYIKASSQHRIIASKQGKGHTSTCLLEVGKGDSSQHYVSTFTGLLLVLGYKQVPTSDYFKFKSNLFDTHYNIIHQLHELGFITKPNRDRLCQKTPHLF